MPKQSKPIDFEKLQKDIAKEKSERRKWEEAPIIPSIRTPSASQFPLAATEVPWVEGLRLGMSRNLPAGVRGLGESLMVDPEHPVLGTARNWAESLYGLAKTAGTAGLAATVGRMDPVAMALGQSPEFQQYQKDLQEKSRAQLGSMAKGMATSLAEGPANIIGGYRERDDERIARGGGQTFGALLGLAGAAKAPKVPAASRQAVRRVGRTPEGSRVAAGLRESALSDISRAFNPQTLADKAVLDRYGHMFLERGDRAWMGKTFEKNIKRKRDEYGQQLRELEDSIKDSMPDVQIDIKPMREQIAQHIEELKDSWANEKPAIERLETLERQFAKLDAEVIDGGVDFDFIFNRRRQVDAAVAERGGYMPNATMSEKAAIASDRYVATLLRKGLQEISPEYKALNKEFSLYQRGAEIIDNRTVRGRGIQDPVMHSMGRISDDLLAASIGYAVGGVPGMVAAGTMNLMRTRRGLRSQLGTLKQRAAERLVPTPIPMPSKNIPAP